MLLHRRQNLTSSQVYNHPDKDIFQPLLQNLTQCLNTLILSSPENFVSPSTWSKYREALKACLPAGDEARHSSFGAINTRNEQLAAAANRSQPAARHILVRMLDGTLQTPMAAELPVQCWGVSKDKSALARALLEWCTSLYRPGLAKIYVTSRILQHWSTLGLDATMAVLDFLDVDVCEEQARKATLYHVVCELVRSSIFSVARYVQWLIARGGLRNPEDVVPDGPGPTRLLAEIPPHALAASHRDLRSGILRRASFSVVDEAEDVELAIKHLKHAFGIPLDPTGPLFQRGPLPIPKLVKRIASASRALKAEIGAWLRASLAASVEEKDKEGAQAAEISPAMFYAVRAVLEAAGDFSMLGDILKSLTKHSGVEILAAIADTVSRHFFIFSALGASIPLFRSLHQRLKAAVREQGIALRPLLASLVVLAPRIPGMEELASQLKKDLALSDRQNPVDACSPVSDNMVARLQDDAGDLHEEIEKLLAGGSSLDRNTMERLFQTVVQRLQACWGEAKDKQRAYSTLLGRLRVFDTQHFDGLMIKWLLYLRTLGSRPSILTILPLLVTVGCLDISAILATASDFPAGQGAGIARAPTGGASAPQVVHITYRTRYMQEVLLLLTAPIRPAHLLTADEAYRFSILQDQAVRDCPKEVLGLIFLALAEYSYARGQNDFEGLPLESPSAQEKLEDLLKRLVLRDAPGVARALSVRSPSPHVSGWIDHMTTKLLIPAADGETHVTFDQVLELTNEFTLPFCQVKLALSLGFNDQTSQEAADRQQSHVELFGSAMDKAISAGNISWVGMLSCLSSDITQHLKIRAQNRFLELLPSLRNPSSTSTASETADATLAHNLQMAENLLSVMDAIMRGSNNSSLPPIATAQTGNIRQPPTTTTPSSSQALAPAVVDKLVDLWELLAAPDDHPAFLHLLPPYQDHLSDDPTNTAPDPSTVALVAAKAKTAVLRHWLPLTLNLVTLHAQGFDLSRQSNEVRARMLVACAGLLGELDALCLVVNPNQSGSLFGSLSGDRAEVGVGGVGIGNEVESWEDQGVVGEAVATLARRVFDLSCLLVDNLVEDARAMCVRAVAGCATGDARLRYIFSIGAGSEGGGGGGGGDGVSGGLVLCHRDKATVGGGGGAGTPSRNPAGAATPSTAGGGAGSAGNGNNTAAPATLLFSGLLGTPAALWGFERPAPERLSVFNFRRWETLSEPTPNVGDNDTALSLGLFDARRVQ